MLRRQKGWHELQDKARDRRPPPAMGRDSFGAQQNKRVLLRDLFHFISASASCSGCSHVPRKTDCKGARWERQGKFGKNHRQEVINKCLCSPVLSTSPASGSSVGSEQGPLLPSPSTISTDGAGEAGKGTSSPEQAAGRRRLFQRVVTHLSHPASRPFCTSCMSSI